MATLYTTTLATLAMLLGGTQGHLIMNTPTPYNYHGNKAVQVSPLGGEYPFPCQGRTDNIVETTTIQAGGSQVVKFTGSAVHGGGSCQFSVTYEYPPPADKSKWKTIYTIIGGCPASAQGNIQTTGKDEDGREDGEDCGNETGTECVRQFSVPIPKDLPSGNATFAWTWFNKIGNRELYMNCAPVEITGGADDDKFLQDLPDLFVANIDGECTTGNGVFNIPNPGRYGKVLEEPTQGSEGSCPKADGLPSFEGGGSNGGGDSGNGSGGDGGYGGGNGNGNGNGNGDGSSNPSPTVTPTPSNTGLPGGVFVTLWLRLWIWFGIWFRFWLGVRLRLWYWFWLGIRLVRWPGLLTERSHHLFQRNFIWPLRQRRCHSPASGSRHDLHQWRHHPP
ncbi:hypothetical protein VTH82DRAFT_4034 [Thermothelomyces myriococcoides]